MRDNRSETCLQKSEYCCAMADHAPTIALKEIWLNRAMSWLQFADLQRPCEQRMIAPSAAQRLSSLH